MRNGVRKIADACIALLAMVTYTSAHAILIRHDFELNSEYNRYINLANQDRFYSVGAVGIVTPFLSGNTSSSLCTGSLIAPTIVLTAAHCMFAIDSATNNRVSVFTPGNSPYAGTFNGGAFVGFGGGPTYASSYAGVADRVSIYPGYDGSYGSGDIALVRIPNMIGAAPSSYLPLYTGSDETSPSPSLAVTVGYGDFGNGRVGRVIGSNVSMQKLAGITMVENTSSQNVLSSQFFSPGQIFENGLPSNFLQAAPANGDSGGPLVKNINGVNTIIGTVGGGPGETPLLFDSGGGGNLYNETNYWVRTSAFAGWIAAESTTLSGLAPVLTSGSSSTDPLMVPAVPLPEGNGTQKDFVFLAAGGTIYLDPDTADIEEFNVISGPLVNAVTLPENDFSIVKIFVFDVSTGTYIDIGASITGGETYTFDAPVASFRLTGLLGEQATVGVGLSGSGVVQLRWTSISNIPEPNQIILFLLGMPLLLLIGGNLKRNAQSYDAFRRMWIVMQ